jgi:hypothetical protein
MALLAPLDGQGGVPGGVGAAWIVRFRQKKRMRYAQVGKPKKTLINQRSGAGAATRLSCLCLNCATIISVGRRHARSELDGPPILRCASLTAALIMAGVNSRQPAITGEEPICPRWQPH